VSSHPRGRPRARRFWGLVSFSGGMRFPCENPLRIMKNAKVLINMQFCFH
jgi:hypothetical protein